MLLLYPCVCPGETVMPLRKFAFVLLLVLAGGVVFAGVAAAQSAPAVSATTIPDGDQMQPADLAKILTSNAPKPLILQVGSKILFGEARIKGAKYAGPGSNAQGLQLLDKAVSGLQKDALVVIYCGCCPWNRCPNVGPAFAHLHEHGYTNVKVLYMANNFGDDWARKGYPRE
jgi:thiosulfate/3-mercaptopyruvate sulfurtransferase